MKRPGRCARPTERRRSCASRNIFTSPGRTIGRCAWTPIPEHRPGSFISAIGRLPQVRPRCREIRWPRGKSKRGGRGGPPPDPNAPPQGKGTLKVTTSHLKAGYLRKNGVPYSENAVLTEYYDMIKEHNGDVMLVVMIVVDRPAVSARTVYYYFALQETGRRRWVETHAVLREMVRRGIQDDTQSNQASWRR